ncbi:nuclear factor, erythroid 2 like 1, partial [Homo sapiens]
MTRLDRSSHSGGGHAKGSRPLNSLLAGHRVAQPASAPGSRASVQDIDLIDILWRQDIDLGAGR